MKRIFLKNKYTNRKHSVIILTIHNCKPKFPGNKAEKVNYYTTLITLLIESQKQANSSKQLNEIIYVEAFSK